jgi:hypothetical protein
MNKLATFLSVLAMVAVAPLARADFQISINGVPCASGAGNPANPGGEVGNERPAIDQSTIDPDHASCYHNDWCRCKQLLVADSSAQRH